MRPSEVVSRAARYLAAHGVERPRQEAEALLMSVLGVDRAGLYSRAAGLDSRSARRYGRALCQRCGGVPLQHLTGEQPFRRLTLAVEPGVFVPRPETEVLVERAIECVRDVVGPVIVDVGTGTGAVALSLASERPDARVLATDDSEEAVRLARRNAERLGLGVAVALGDLLEPVPAELRGAVDVVVSNPPYVTREEYASLPAEVRRDPYGALVGGTDVHRRLVSEAPGWLREGGWLVVEVGAGQGSEVHRLFESAFDAVEVLADLAGRDRVVRGRLAAGRRE